MKIVSSLRYAWHGVVSAFRSELNFRIECIATILVIMTGVIFKISRTEWLVIILNISIVLSLELINTAVESACDLVTKEYHPSIKVVKDVSAAAVSVAALAALACGLIIFLPKFFHYLQ